MASCTESPLDSRVIHLAARLVETTLLEDALTKRLAVLAVSLTGGRLQASQSRHAYTYR